MRRHAHALILTIALITISCWTDKLRSGSVEAAFDRHLTNIQVTGDGVVTRILRDDKDGAPHQRFILKLASGQTVLIDHNIEVAPRIDDLKAGDTVSFSGEYVWSEHGGLIHWTHHDPSGRHIGGWIKHGGQTYE